MIQDLDETLKRLLVQKLSIDLASVDVRFEMPTKEWTGSLLKPTVNLFLHDVRENRDLRNNESQLVRSDKTGVLHRPPARVDLTYYISIWASDVADEHRLLGRVLTGLLQYPVLPEDVLVGAMQKQPFPLRAWIAHPERTPNAWDFWGTLEGNVKAGVSYVVTAAIETGAPQDVHLVTQRVLKLDEGSLTEEL